MRRKLFYTAVAGAVPLSVFAAVMVADRISAQPAPPPPSVAVSQWAAKCQASSDSCLGDIFYTSDGTRIRRFGDHSGHRNDTQQAEAWFVNGGLGRITRVVEVGSPGYGAASEDFYRNFDDYRHRN